MRIQFTRKQLQAKNLLKNNSILCYGGGIRGGKSYFLLLQIIEYCFRYDKSRWVIIRETMPTMKRNLFPTLNKLLEETGLNQYIKDWNQQTNTITFCNDSQILFMSESYDEDKDLNRFRGLEVNGGGMDEVNECHEETFNKLIERSGSWTGAGDVPIKIILTCNPSHGWVKDKFYDRHKLKKLPLGWSFIQALISDNPTVNESYLESLKANMNKYDYEVFVNGNWDIRLAGVLFNRSELKRFSLKEHRKIAAERKEFNKLGYWDVADTGVDHLAAAIGDIQENKIMVTDVIFNNEGVGVTKPMTIALLLKEQPQYIRIESNNQGGVFAQWIRPDCPLTSVQTIANTTNKLTRILMQEQFVKDYFYFCSEEEIVEGSDYDLFVQQLCSYMRDGSIKKDDAPDCITGLAQMVRGFLPHLFTVK